ncbi:oligoribonuclease isoform X2 [Carex littledalei]|uniref:Oligoribonuclease isoform X2 n=1 Tax=Carex littledalei TaxID=544730 RepID=A0A833R3Q6_9POAL|nr:oligoribonuclease isoform X2 [Carex littledalei]
MSRLSNIFSVLGLDSTDDAEELSAIASSSKANSSAKPDKEKQKESFKDKKHTNGEAASFLDELKKPLVWIDLEMTGLDVTQDRILEIACVITDGKLTKTIEGPDLVISQPKDCLDNMGDWCTSHHAASGLTERVLRSTISEREAEKQVLDFVKKHIGSQTPQLAGNSVYVDYLFLKKYMPSLALIFPHVLVDVSSIMALCIRWFPKEKKMAPAKEKRHRAMDDIKESIKELKFYKENIFKLQKRSR